MADDGYSSSAWDSTDNAGPTTANHVHTHSRSQGGHITSLQEQSPTSPPDIHMPLLPPKSSSPPPRSSTDSAGRSSTSKWLDSIPVTVEHKDALSTIPSDAGSLVETSFDENVLRALCDLDVSGHRRQPFSAQLNTPTTVRSPPLTRPHKTEYGLV